MSYKILIADDDMDLVEMLKSYFELKDFEVLTAGDGMAAMERLEDDPDILLLDINMPRLDGLEVCKRIRTQTDCPIIFLTARVEEQDKINGLMSGGDDYISKPFSILELEARIIAHLKREARHHKKAEEGLKNGLVIDYIGRMVYFDKQEIELTKLEYGIIEFLSMHPEQIFDKERIYEKICGYDGAGDSRVITELIYRIRRKLETFTDQEFIATVWGMGYKWKK